MDTVQHGIQLFCSWFSRVPLSRLIDPFPQAIQQVENISFPQAVVLDLLLTEKGSDEVMMSCEAAKDSLPRFSGLLGKDMLFTEILTSPVRGTLRSPYRPVRSLQAR